MTLLYLLLQHAQVTLHGNVVKLFDESVCLLYGQCDQQANPGCICCSSRFVESISSSF